MSKVRINDLARELEVKSKVILDLLPEVGVTEKKTHSSSVEEDEAVRVRAALGRGGKVPSNAAGKSAANEQKPKIDLSNISRPGDVLRAIQQQKEERETQGRTHPGAPPAQRPTVAAAAGPAKAAAAPPASSLTPPAVGRGSAAGAPDSSVPAGSARLRITLSAAHEEAHVDQLLGALETLRLTSVTD